MAVEVGKNALDRASKPADGTETPDRGLLAMGVAPTGEQIPLLLSADGSITAELDASDLEIGAVELKDSDTDVRANIKAANTARTTATVVVATQNVDAAGRVLNVGSAAMAASAPVTVATDDTQFGAVGAAASATGGVHAQLRSIADNTDTLPTTIGRLAAASSLSTALSTEDAAKVPALGVAASAAASPVVLASDDAQLGAVGAAADVDGHVHGQLRSIGEAVEIIDDAVAANAGAPTKIVNVGATVESTVPTELTDGQLGALWIDTFKRLVLKGYNLGAGSLDTSEVAPALTMTSTGTWTTLTAAGNTAVIDFSQYNALSVQVVVAAIDTSVTYGIYGSNDGTNFGIIGSTITRTANGTYMEYFGGEKFKYIMFTFVSEVGGAAVTLAPTYFCGNI